MLPGNIALFGGSAPFLHRRDQRLKAGPAAAPFRNGGHGQVLSLERPT